MTVKWENVGIRELPYSSEELSNTITELSNSFKDKLNKGHFFLNLEPFNSIRKLSKLNYRALQMNKCALLFYTN